MELKIEDAEIEKLIKEVMENCPECSISLDCESWNYEKCEYIFYDYDEEETYNVDIGVLKKGLEKMIEDISNKKLFVGLSQYDFLDPCNWDAVAVDALIQYSIFGELIYG